MKTNRFDYPNFPFGSGIGRLIQDAFEGFEDLGGLFNRSGVPQTSPRADLHEDESHFYVTFELPGLNKSDITVAFEEGSLHLTATVSRETPDGRKNFPIKRSLRLPDQVGDGDIRAKLEDGILTVAVPKAEVAKPRQINIE